MIHAVAQGSSRSSVSVRWDWVCVCVCVCVSADVHLRRWGMEPLLAWMNSTICHALKVYLPEHHRRGEFSMQQIPCSLGFLANH